MPLKSSMLDNVQVGNAVLGSIREHEDEAATIPGIAAELIAERFQASPYLIRGSLTSNPDRDVDDRLCGESWDGGGANVLNTGRALAQRFANCGSEALSDRCPLGSCGGQTNGPVVDSEP